MEFFMKKLLLVLLILVVVGTSVFAFDPLSYPPPLGGGGNVLLDAGVGYYYGLSMFGYNIGIPPLFVHLEYALPVEVPISIGGGISFFQWKYGWNDTITWVTPSVRGNWHWGFDVDWLDLYTGLSLMWEVVSWSDRDYGSGLYGWGGLRFGGQVGAHFYFSDRVGAMVEAGYPYSKVGIAFKLGDQRYGRVRNTGGLGTAAVTTDVNMRAGPGLDYSVITSIRQGTVVQLTGEIIEGWTQIIYNGRRGWVSSPYLTTR
jgi:hypothetical protein